MQVKKQVASLKQHKQTAETGIIANNSVDEAPTPKVFLLQKLNERTCSVNALREEELIRQEIADFSLVKDGDWIPVGCLPLPDEKRIRLNVGGQVNTIMWWRYSICTILLQDSSLFASPTSGHKREQCIISLSRNPRGPSWAKTSCARRYQRLQKIKTWIDITPLVSHGILCIWHRHGSYLKPNIIVQWSSNLWKPPSMKK